MRYLAYVTQFIRCGRVQLMCGTGILTHKKYPVQVYKCTKTDTINQQLKKVPIVIATTSPQLLNSSKRMTDTPSASQQLSSSMYNDVKGFQVP